MISVISTLSKSISAATSSRNLSFTASHILSATRLAWILVVLSFGSFSTSANAIELVNDGVISGSISVPGESDEFTFDASAGEAAHIRVVKTSVGGFYPKVWLYNPDGTLNKVGSIGSSIVPFDCYSTSSSCQLNQTGTYRLVVEDYNSDDTGSYEIHFAQVLTSNENGSLINDGVVSGEITLGDIDTFVFDASAGEAAHIRVVKTSVGGFYPKVWLYNPDGTLNKVGSIGSSIVPFDCYSTSSSCQLNQTGTYRLVVEDYNSDDTGSYEIHFAQVLTSNENGSLINDGVVSGEITLGDIDTFVFDASAGEAAHIRVVKTSGVGFYPKVWLYNPDGSMYMVKYDYGAGTVAFDCYATSSTCQLNQTGTYRLLVEDYYWDDTGSYEIRLFNDFHLEFSTIPNVQVGIDVPVTINAVDASGVLATAYNDCVNLNSNYGFQTVDDPEICLSNGTATTNIRIFGSGASDTVIHAESGGFAGYSNSFDVTDPLAVRASLSVFVTKFGSTFTGSVYLEDKDGVITEQTQPQILFTFIFYHFDDLLPGTYKIWAEDGTWKSPRNTTINVSAAHSLKPQTTSLTVQDIGRRPVLLVPGFAGSSSNGWNNYDSGLYPRMPKNEKPPAGKLRIFDGATAFNLANAGFSDLDSYLTSTYNVYTVPWDWRIALDPADGEKTWVEYLMPMIEEARNPIKEPKGQPIIYEFDQVDIVAHSMGGLLVRSYIQSKQYESRNDIRKLAMVGTPNEGSANAYYMAQGGDPRATDAIHAANVSIGEGCDEYTLSNSPYCFYSNITLHLYQLENDNKSPFDYTFAHLNLFGQPIYLPDYSKVISPEELVLFYDEHVPTGAQLLPTFPFLDVYQSSSLAPLETNSNTFLEALNNNLNPDANTNRYSSSCGDPTKVYTKAFASYDESTLTEINVIPNNVSAAIYPNGIPVVESPTTENSGDGTVPVNSAVASDLLVSRLAASKGSHFQLMYAFRDEIASFLGEACP